MSNIRNGLSCKEAGMLGYLASKNTNEKLKHKRIDEYYKQPVLCKNCNSVIPYNKKDSKFCSRSCAASYNNKLRGARSIETKEKIRKTLTKSRTIESKNIHKQKSCIYCKYCGAEKGKCIDPYVCSKYRLFGSLEKFGFDRSTIGTLKVVEEFYRIKLLLREFYNINSTNDNMLKTNFNYTSGSANFIKLLRSLDIPILNSADAVSNAWLNGKMQPNEYTNYHAGWHTTWDNKHVYLRSSYEKEFACELDNNKIPYEVEGLRIKYYNTAEQSYRCAIPDFYLPYSNTIVEVKSTYTLKNCINEMKDKFIEYKRLGYNTKLILNKKEIDLNSITIENIDNF